jgi:hypothetical protein
MRAINYLAEKAKLLKEERKTLAQIDRVLAIHGLRRVGSGRAIPDPSLREELTFMLAVAGQGGRSVMRAADTAVMWGGLPCVSGRGALLAKFKGKTLIETLETLCEDIAAGRFEEEISLKLNLTDEDATISFPDRDGNQHLLFGLSGTRVSYRRTSEETIHGGYLRDIAFSTRSAT